MRINHKAAQIMAMIRSGRMINIGGRPVLAPKPRKSATDRSRAYSIQLALAFVAIYIIWGSTYLAIRYAVETIPPLVTAGIRHSIAGTILLAWAWARGFRPTRAHWLSGLVVGALFFLIGHGTLHWAEQYVGSGLAALLLATEPMFILVLAWSMGQQKSSRLSALGLGLGVLGVATLTGVELTVRGSSPGTDGSARGFFGVVGGSGDLAEAQAAFGRARAHGPPNDLRRGDAARSCSTDGRVSRHTLGGHFFEVNLGIGVSDRLWIGSRVHCLYMAVAAMSPGTGGDAHIRESSCGCVSGLAARFRTADHASRVGVGGYPRSDYLDPQRGADCGAVRVCPRLCAGQIGREMRLVIALQFGAHDPQMIHILATHGSKPCDNRAGRTAGLGGPSSRTRTRH